MAGAFLEVENLRTHFPVANASIFQRRADIVRAVDGVSFSLQRGEVLGLVGESGCGKSTLGRTILQLIPPTEGTVILEGRNLNHLGKSELRHARRDFQMIFQDPYASLDPRMTVMDTIGEALRAHRKIPRGQLRERAIELLGQVGLLPEALGKYPHEFSGGQRQRIAIARAIAVMPKLIVADEPVSALDVSIQAQIINLIARLRREMELTLIFISHDLSMVKHIADRVAVMYLGQIVEIGSPRDVLQSPLHPYAKALISAVPVPDPDGRNGRKRIVLSGDPPSPMNPPRGCRFHTRCPFVIEACRQTVPPLEQWRPQQRAACIRVPEINVVSGGSISPD